MCKGNAASVGISDSMRNTRIGNAADIINIGKTSVLDICLCHYLAVAHSHSLNVYPLINGVGIAVICPEECADAHFICSWAESFAGGGSDLHDLSGLQFLVDLISQLLESKGLK